MVLLLTAVALLLWSFCSGKNKKRYLVFEAEEGEICLELEIAENEEFSIEFIHSVNQSPVIDFYEARSDGIYVTKTIYYAFGAGVQSALEEGQELSYTEDGAMMVSGFNRKIDKLSYLVGKVSDHLLHIGGKEHSLGDACGRGRLINIYIR